MSRGLGLMLMFVLVFLLGYAIYCGVAFAMNLALVRKMLPGLKADERIFMWYKRRAGIVGSILSVVVICSFALLYRDTAPTDATTSGAKSKPAEPTPDQIAHDVDNREVQRQIAEAKAIQEQQFAVAKAQQRLFLETVRRTEEAIRKWETELRQWDEEVEPLLSNDDGRHVATSPESVLQFRAILQEKRPGAGELTSMREALETLASPIRASLTNPNDATAPPDSYARELDGLLRRADGAHLALHRLREQVAAIVRSTKAAGHEPTITLAAAIEAQQDEESQEDASRMAERMAAARLSASETVIQAQEAAVAQEADTEASRITQQAEIDRLKAEQRQLLALANDPATIAEFAPFLEKGRYKLFSNAPQYYDIPQPVSYSKLDSLKILSDFNRFVQAGCWGCYGPQTLKSGENDRPRWSAPSSESDLKKMRERFEMFQKLAPVWKEQGKLAP